MTEETIFCAALEKKDPAERIAYLDAACAGNPKLRQGVEALLRSHEAPSNVLDRAMEGPATVGGATQPCAAPILESCPLDSDLAILGPAREPGSLGSLDHYEILEMVGRGGMGVVFKARDTKLQRIVAIKVLAAHLAADGMSRKRFVREAQAAAAIRDTHVVGIHAVNDESTVPYLVMEFIGGVTLEKEIRAHGPPTLKEILRIGVQAAEGLAAAHRQGLVHRDVKPANILLENHVQRVKITDFGLARAADNVRLTQSGVIAGTPLYMSPEQACGEALDPRSDLFSLGSVLYFMCTGRAAFAGSNTMAVLKHIREDAPRPIRPINSEIPDWLAALVEKLLAKDPADRIQSAGEVAELLAHHLAHLQNSGSTPAAPVQRVNGKRNWMRLAAACLVAAGILSFAVYLGGARLFRMPADNRIANGQEDVGAPPPGNAAQDKKQLGDDKPLPARDPNLLTVSKRPEDGGDFRTINAALAKVGRKKKTIRVLDDSTYEEQIRINRPDDYRGMVLEAAAGKKPTLALPPNLPLKRPNNYCVGIDDVAQVTVRGFCLNAAKVDQVYITQGSPGTVLEDLELVGDQTDSCVRIHNLMLSAEDAPVQIQHCKLRSDCGTGVFVEARVAPEKARVCANIIVRDNSFIDAKQAMTLIGAPQRTLVVGNQLVDCDSGIDLGDFLPEAESVLVANNTLYRNKRPLRIWDENHAGLDCRNIRIQNNLVLNFAHVVDFFYFDHIKGDYKDSLKPGNTEKLFQAWRFSHNWREVPRSKPKSANAKFWIPGPDDVLRGSIEVRSRERGDANFLRPPNDSELATRGAGTSDPALPLPSYVGAVPPEGVEAWDWARTWKALAK